MDNYHERNLPRQPAQKAGLANLPPRKDRFVARIFLVLALFAVALLLINLVMALTIGDFGAASRRYVAARQVVEQLQSSPSATRAQVEEAFMTMTEAAGQLHRQRNRFWPHVWLGIVASLVSLLVNSISVTYFIGTSRWCGEVVEAYGMERDLADQSQRLKRRCFPWALTAILMTLAIATLGAAADPYSSIPNPAAWVAWHWSVGLLGFAVIAISFLMQVGAVGANYEVIQKILAEAQRLRELRGAGAEKPLS